MSYAQGTKVPESRTRMQFEALLRQKRATEFAYAWTDDGDILIGFRVDGFPVRFRLPCPRPEDYASTPSGKDRAASAANELANRELGRRWRALLAVVKAKFVAVEEGISDLGAEFMADIVTPSGKTAREVAGPKLAAMASAGELPKLLPG